jgi:hypothetical protein
MQDMLSGIAAAGPRGARGQGLSSSRSNPNLFERDEAASANDSLFALDSSDRGPKGASCCRKIFLLF